jgi:kynurenine formamidase
MQYIDLTHTITDKMPSHPLDSKTELQTTATYQKDGVACETLHGSTHMGTHIDAPGHFVENGKKITDFPLSTFMGKALCIDARNKKIIDKNLLDTVTLQKDLIVLFYTGWDTQFFQPTYFYDHPVISNDCAQHLVNASIKMVGVDFPSVDQHPYSIHKLLLSNNIVIIENMTNLALLLNKQYNLIALPLKIDAYGSPARVIAEIK